ncbi:MAG: GNAT family N-acetyltransferase [Candidatus Rokuibacteriota bacterium]
MDPRITFRAIRPDDASFLYEVYASTREDELRPVPWTPAEKAAFLRQQFHAQHTCYRQHHAAARFDVIELEGRPIGRLYVDRRPDEVRIVDIALLPAHRGAGIGTGILRGLLSEAAASGRPVRIHVEQTNPARRLYQRLGFVRIADHGIYQLLECTPASSRTATT